MIQTNKVHFSDTSEDRSTGLETDRGDFTVAY